VSTPQKSGRGLLHSMLYSTASFFKASDLSVEKTKNPKPKLKNSELIFGASFTDHMLEVDYNQQGWEKPRIHPYGPFVLDPSCTVFHYAIECFEGLKAYKDKTGGVRLFRPEENMKRMITSAKRLALPTFDEKEFLECIKKLILLDESFIPTERGYSLYIRPALISTENTVMVAPPRKAKLFVILSPVGPYYKSGFKPVKLFADPIHVRAWSGGTGNYKLGANYAGGIVPQLECDKKGYSQILWLYNDQVTEVGTMNMFVFWKNEKGEKELITAPLEDGTILPGVTRKFILELSRKWGEFKVTEGTYTMSQVAKAIQEKRIIEAFGAGTAAIVTPVEAINYKGQDYHIPINKEIGAGDLTHRILNSIMAIQYGEVPHSWSIKIN